MIGVVLELKGRVDKSKLRPRVLSHDNVVKDYDVSLSDIELDEIVKVRICELSKELRSLLRAKDNLQVVVETIQHLESQPHQLGLGISSELNNRALFAYAVVLYGACFVRGGADRTYPLATLGPNIDQAAIHNSILTYRHKLFSHLDENHDVRTDELEWSLLVKENYLLPNGPRMSGTKILLDRGNTNWEWIEHIKMIKDLIVEREKLIASEINHLIGNVLIE